MVAEDADKVNGRGRNIEQGTKRRKVKKRNKVRKSQCNLRRK